jgi:hypothetical protein
MHRLTVYSVSTPPENIVYMPCIYDCGQAYTFEVCCGCNILCTHTHRYFLSDNFKCMAIWGACFGKTRTVCVCACACSGNHACKIASSNSHHTDSNNLANQPHTHTHKIASSNGATAAVLIQRPGMQNCKHLRPHTPTASPTHAYCCRIVE